MKNSPLALLALVLAIALVGPSPSSAAAPKSGGDLLADRIDVMIGLEHPQGLDRFVRNVSDPRSDEYRRYRSVPYLIKRYGAAKRKRSRVLGWLEQRGLRGRLDKTRTWVAASVRRSELPRALFAGRSRKRAASGGGARGRVPRALRGEVTSVSALDSSELHRPAPVNDGRRLRASSGSSVRPLSGTPEGCADGLGTGGFTPNQYTTAYGHADLHERGITGAGQRIALVEIDSFKRSDISTWADCFGLEPPPIRRHKTSGKGFIPTQGETPLDLEVLTAGAPGLDRIEVYLGAASQLGVLTSTTAALGTSNSRPDVISISLGGCEVQTTGAIGYVRAMDHALAIGAGAGISTLIATGDQGSAPCRNNGGDVFLPLLSVNSPSSSNYATAVGGTNLVLDDENGITDQITWNDLPDQYAGSTGGYSVFNQRPWYQRGAHGGGKGSYGARMVPDVSGLADIRPGYAYYCSRAACQHDGQSWFQIGGTSAATPLLAAGVALANQAAAERGQANLGLLNPLLYEIGLRGDRDGLFNDVTEGDNDTGAAIPPEQGGTGPLGCCTAKPGYDLATGWGSPDVAALSRAAIRAAR